MKSNHLWYLSKANDNSSTISVIEGAPLDPPFAHTPAPDGHLLGLVTKRASELNLTVTAVLPFNAPNGWLLWLHG